MNSECTLATPTGVRSVCNGQSGSSSTAEEISTDLTIVFVSTFKATFQNMINHSLVKRGVIPSALAEDPHFLTSHLRK